MISQSLRILSLFGIWALCANIGIAQESQQPDAAGSQQIQEETMPAAVSEESAAAPPPIEEIVVTGSRIPARCVHQRLAHSGDHQRNLGTRRVAGHR